MKFSAKKLASESSIIRLLKGNSKCSSPKLPLYYKREKETVPFGKRKKKEGLQWETWYSKGQTPTREEFPSLVPRHHEHRTRGKSAGIAVKRWEKKVCRQRGGGGTSAHTN